jgi:flagellar hook-associated protein 1 FlgK
VSSLFAALGTAANALDVLEKAIGVVQNNVANANTPGYVTQTPTFLARPFDPAGNVWGGVESGAVQSARNGYAEQAVWSANQRAGSATQEATSLDALQNVFDVSGTSGIPGALSQLSAAFSSWSSNPTDTTAREQVLTTARNLSQSFNQASTGIDTIRSQTDQQLATTVSQINQYAAQIANINLQIRRGSGSDAGLQSQLYNTIEQLSSLAPVTVRTESDGTATVLLGGQSPLAIGQNASPLSLAYPPNGVSANYPLAAPDAQLLAADGHDVTALANEGQLGGLLAFRNTALPAVVGDGQQQGSLNQLAQSIADRVNGLLTSGQSSAGPPPVAGVPLFTYSSTSATAAAATLAIDPLVTAADLAAGTSTSANGVASALAGLANSHNTADQVGLSGLNYTDFYSNIASQIGEQAASASSTSAAQTQILTQAQNLRAQVSGVSLNDQAASLMQFQQGYQAAAQMITVINNITQSLLQMMQGIR